MNDEKHQNWVEQVSELWDAEATRAGVDNWRDLSSGILLHIAARHPLHWPPDNPDVGKVGFRVEAWPHDPGANGQDYHSGHLPADEAARVLRDIADRCDSWADPDCPWAGQKGHAPAPPPLSNEERQTRDQAEKDKAQELKERR